MHGRKPEIDFKASSLGDRAVAIAALIAILATGFFGTEPEVPTKQLPASSATQSAGH